MAQIGAAVLKLSASADGMQRDLKKASGYVNGFAGKIKAVPEIGEKITASFGRMDQVGRAFEMMTSNVSGLEKAVAGVEAGIGAMTTGIQLATKVTHGLKAALLSTGIGAAILAVGSLMSLMSRDRRAATESRRDPGEPPGPSGAYRHGRARLGSHSTRDSIRSLPARRDLAARIGDIGPRISSLADSRTADAAGRVRGESSDETALRTAMDRRAELAASGHAATISSHAFARLGEEITRASLAMATIARADRVSGLVEVGESARREAATMGMSAEAAAEYGATLRRVKIDVGGLTVAVMRSIDPMTAWRTETDRLHREMSASRITREAYTAGIAEATKMYDGEIAGIAKLRAELAGLTYARERHAMSTRAHSITMDGLTDLERRRKELHEIDRLERKGDLSARAAGRARERIGRAVLDAAPGRGAGAALAPRALMQGTSEAVAEVSRIMRESMRTKETDEERIRRAIDALAGIDGAALKELGLIRRVLEELRPGAV